METTFEKSSDTLGRLIISITKEDVNKDVNKKLKDYAKTAKIKGFRPGNVPISYVQKLYGKSVLVDEVINKVSKTVNEYIADNKLKVVGDPLPEQEAFNIDWDNDNLYKFAYEVGLASDFKVDLNSLPAIETYDIQPSDAQVDKTIEELQKRFGDDLEPEEAEQGDLIFGKLKQESSDFEFQSGIPTDKVKEKSKKIFLGLEKGSEVKFDIQSIFDEARNLGFATGKSDEDAAALSGEFDFTVERISRVSPAKINQEFFDKVLGPEKAKDEAEFKKQLSEVMKSNYDNESELMKDYDIDETLLKTIPIELPDEFLKKWLLQINEGKVTEEDINKEFDFFKRGLKLDLIKAEIASQSEIKIEYDNVLDEVKSEIKNYFSQQGGPGFEGMDDFVEKMAIQQLKDNKDNAFRKYYNKAFSRGVNNFIKEKATFKSKKLSIEEFNELAEEKYKNS